MGLLVPPVAVRMVCGYSNPLAKTVLATFWNAATDGHHTLVSIAVGFVEVQPGFLQLILTQTCVKWTSLDSSRSVVDSGIRFNAIWAASKKLEQDEW